MPDRGILRPVTTDPSPDPANPSPAPGPATVPGPHTNLGVLGVDFADPQHGWLATLDSTDFTSR